MDNDMERRRFPRIEVNWPVAIFAGEETVEGETENISVDGISICVEEPLRLNEIFQMSIFAPDRPPIIVSGKVTWSELYGIDENDQSIGLGVCFVEIAAADRQYLQELVESRESA